MKRKFVLGLFFAIAALGMMLAGCNIPVSGSGTYAPLIIRGTSINGDDIEIEISTTRTISRTVLTPMNGDSYVLRVNGREVSRGTIEVGEYHMTFYPSNGGQSFVGSYTGEGEHISLFGVPNEDGTLNTGITPSPPPAGTPGGPSAAETFAASLNADYETGTASVSAGRVTLLKNVELKKTLTIPAGVTLVVPTGRTLTANGSDNADAMADPDSDVANNIYNPAGSGSWQITGPGTLEVDGALAVRNRTLRMAKTVLRPGATYTLLALRPDIGFAPVGNITDLFTLASGATLEVAYAALPTGQQTGILVDFYTFTLRGAATLNGEFKFADSSNTVRDTVIIENSGVLTFAPGASGGTITSGGKVQVRQGGTIIFNPQRPPMPAATGIGSVEVLPGGMLEIADPDGNMKVIGPTNDYMYRPGSGAVIEMKPKTYGSIPLFEYIFRGGTITTRTMTPAGGIVWMDVDYTIESGATLNIPAGSMAILVGSSGFMTSASAGTDMRTIPFGTLTVNGTLSVGGKLLLDGLGTKITLANANAVRDSEKANIGLLDMTNAGGLVRNATVKSGFALSGNVLEGAAYP